MACVGAEGRDGMGSPHKIGMTSPFEYLPNARVMYVYTNIGEMFELSDQV